MCCFPVKCELTKRFVRSLTEVIRLPIDLSCLTDRTLKGLAQRCSADRLATAKDKKGKLLHKLYKRRAEIDFSSAKGTALLIDSFFFIPVHVTLTWSLLICSCRSCTVLSMWTCLSEQSGGIFGVPECERSDRGGRESGTETRAVEAITVDPVRAYPSNAASSAQLGVHLLVSVGGVLGDPRTACGSVGAPGGPIRGGRCDNPDPTTDVHGEVGDELERHPSLPAQL